MIKGVRWGTGKIEQEVSDFLKRQVRSEVRVNKAYKIKSKENRIIVIANLDSWEQKREVMSRKKELEKGIWIEDDLTTQEREIQKTLRDIAKEEREKGNKARIGYI